MKLKHKLLLLTLVLSSLLLSQCTQGGPKVGGSPYHHSTTPIASKTGLQIRR